MLYLGLFLCYSWLLADQFSTTAGSRMKVTHTHAIYNNNNLEQKNLRLLYRINGSTSEEYIYVAGTNQILQFNAQHLQLVFERDTGPTNFSIFCLQEGHNCDECLDFGQSTLPKGYTSDFCGPRLTDNFVKAWGTSTIPESVTRTFSDPQRFSDLSQLSRSVILNDDRIACENALYVCYSVRHGFCERLQLTNITNVSPWVPPFPQFDQSPTKPGHIPVAGSDPNTFTALAIGTQYVYVATEPNGLQIRTLIDHHPLSARLRNFLYADPQPGPESFLRLNIPTNFPIQYKLAFRYHQTTGKNNAHQSAPAHVYFVLQQPESKEFYRWQPRMARICDDDSQFNSYVELNLACQNCIIPDQKTLQSHTFSALHNAARGTIGQLLAQQIAKFSNATTSGMHGQTPTQPTEALIVAFAAQPVDTLYYGAYAHDWSYPHPDSFGQYEAGAVILNGSALAIFSMTQINAKFDQVIANCLNGEGVSGPKHFLGGSQRGHINCLPDHESKRDLPHYCPSSRTANRFIMGHTKEDTLKAPAFLLSPLNVTGMAITAVSVQFTVAIVITDDGQLFKYEVTGLQATRLISSTQLARPDLPLTSLALDITGSVAFVTSPEQVYRVELTNCPTNPTCTSCLAARDPYCGWCVGEGRCLRLTECLEAGLNRSSHSNRDKSNWDRCKPRGTTSSSPPAGLFTWLNYTDSTTNCPVIKQISPTGVHQSSSPTTPLHNGAVTNIPLDADQQQIILHLDKALAHDLHKLNTGKKDTAGKGPNSNNQWLLKLICAFRTISNEAVASKPLLSGSLVAGELHSILSSISPGTLLDTSRAKMVSSMTNSTELHCLSPPMHKLPVIPPNQASVPIILWLEWSKKPDNQYADIVPALAPALFAVYDCNRLTDCRSCAKSRFGCAWCISEDLCFSTRSVLTSSGQMTNVVCSNTTNADGFDESSDDSPDRVHKVVPSGRASSCPRFKTDGKPITLMSGSALTVKFRVFNILQPVKHFSCVEGCTNQRVMATYMAVESKVTCHVDKIDLNSKLNAIGVLEYEASSNWTQPAAVNCSLDLYWHGEDARTELGHRLVNEDDAQVEIYACGWLAAFCDVCLSLPVRFGCGWCVTSESKLYAATQSRCSTRHQCIEPSTPTRSDSTHRWLQPGDVCPNPIITGLNPLNGTLTGGTVVRIEGRNLGRRVTDLVDPVYLESSQTPLACSILPDSYIPTRSFQCRLGMAKHLTLPLAARFKVMISQYNYQAFSPLFHFRTPQLLHVSPERGPIAGGTRLLLTGNNLNVGAQRMILLLYRSTPTAPVIKGSSVPQAVKHPVPCDILSESDSAIMCQTRSIPLAWTLPSNGHSGQRVAKRSASSRSDGTADASVATGIDETLAMSLMLKNDETITAPSQTYTFVYSPNPQVTGVDRTNVLVSAGTRVRVSGEFLFVVTAPRLVVYFNNSEFSSPCIYLSDELECTSPNLRLLANYASSTRQSHMEPNSLTSDPAFAAQPLPIPSSLHQSHLQTREPISVLASDHTRSWKPHLRVSITSSLAQRNPNWPMRLAYGFIMDGVTGLRVFGQFSVHSDPVVTPFVDGVQDEELDELNHPADDDKNGFDQSDETGEPHDTLASPSSSAINTHLAWRLNKRDLETTASSPVGQKTRPMHQLLRLHGQFDALVAASELKASDELQVTVGVAHLCMVSSVISSEIRCDLDRSVIVSGHLYPVEVQFGQFLVYRPGSVRFVRTGQLAFQTYLIRAIVAVVLVSLLVCALGFAIWRCFDRRQRNYEAKLDQKYAEHEELVVRIFKEDIRELQTNLNEFSQGVKNHNLPYRDYCTFCLYSLFPEYHNELTAPMDPHWPEPGSSSRIGSDRKRQPRSDTTDRPSQVKPHPLLSSFTVPEESHELVSQSISMFYELVCNRQFLCLLVRVIEEDEHTTAQDKSRVASLLCAALHPKMEYLTRVMCDLIAELLQRLHNQGGNRLPTAFRRAEAIVDKMISNWLSFLLYSFIKNNVGENLFYFYRALLQQINTGPKDAVTGKARYTLDNATLLLTELNGEIVSLIVEDTRGLFDLPSGQLTVKVLDCDSISQTKEKILDAIYRNKAFSMQLKPVQLDLIHTASGTILCDWDVSDGRDSLSHGSDKPPYRVKCVRDYGLGNDSRIALVPSHSGPAKSFIASSGLSIVYVFNGGSFDVPPSPADLGVADAARVLGPTRSTQLYTFQTNKPVPSSTLVSTDSLLGASFSMDQPSVSGPGSLIGPAAMSQWGSNCVPPPPRSTSASTNRFPSGLGGAGSVSSHMDFASNLALVYPHRHRPTGLPDPTIWYHLEPPSTGNNELPASITGQSIANQLHHSGITSGTRLLPNQETASRDDGDDRNTDLYVDVRETDFTAPWRWCRRKRAAQPNSQLILCPSAKRGEMAGNYPLLMVQSNDNGKAPCREMQNRAHSTSPPSIVTRTTTCVPNKRQRRRRWKTAKSVASSHNYSEVGMLQASGSWDRLMMNKLPKELFFNRLMVTRLSVSMYMEKLFDVIFSSVLQSCNTSFSIKYLFDFLDDQAVILRVQDPKIVHAWKSNCLQMRFWNQIITNLDYIFDIPLLRHTAFERSFHSLSQAMTYACAPSKERLTTDSSMVKLLFANDISRQWDRVDNYYREIKALPSIPREDVQDVLRQHSANHAADFNVSWAVYELYTKYVKPRYQLLVKRLNQEACKLPSSSYKPPRLFDMKPTSAQDTLRDDRDMMDYNPLEWLRKLAKIDQYLYAATAPSSSTTSQPALSGTLCVRDSTGPNDGTSSIRHAAQSNFLPDSLHSTPNVPRLGGHHRMTDGRVCGTQLYPASPLRSGGDTTDYPDTLRSLNTLTTEFAGDETSRNQHPTSSSIHQQPLHLYHVYGQNDPRQTHTTPLSHGNQSSFGPHVMTSDAKSHAPI